MIRKRTHVNSVRAVYAILIKTPAPKARWVVISGVAADFRDVSITPHLTEKTGFQSKIRDVLYFEFLLKCALALSSEWRAPFPVCRVSARAAATGRAHGRDSSPASGASPFVSAAAAVSSPPPPFGPRGFAVTPTLVGDGRCLPPPMAISAGSIYPRAIDLRNFPFTPLGRAHTMGGESAPDGEPPLSTDMARVISTCRWISGRYRNRARLSTARRLFIGILVGCDTELGRAAGHPYADGDLVYHAVIVGFGRNRRALSPPPTPPHPPTPLVTKDYATDGLRQGTSGRRRRRRHVWMGGGWFWG